MNNSEIKKHIESVIENLKSSFERSQDYLDNQDIRMSLAEMVVSNAEARQYLKRIVEQLQGE